MRITLVKLSDQRHRLEVCRDNGTTEGVELETRSLLLHDLVHYAVEQEAPIPDGFWGMVAGGAPLGGQMMDGGPGAMLAEALTGPMQSLWNGRTTKETYLVHGSRAAPAIVNEDFVARVL